MFKKLAIIPAFLVAASQQAMANELPKIQLGTSTRSTIPTDGSQAESALMGTLWISQQGQIKVIWDGVGINMGLMGANTDGLKTSFSAVFPSLTLDLQELFGKDWMRSVQLKVAGGTYDNDPTRATTDTQIGNIALSLSQTLHQSSSWSWTLTETAATSALFRRKFHNKDKIVEAVPVRFAIDSQIVTHFSNRVSATLAMGAYAMVLESLQGNSQALARGAYLSPSLMIGDRFTVGARLEGSELLVMGSDNAGKPVTNTTAFVRALLARAVRPNTSEHAIALQIGTYHDEALTHADGGTRTGWQSSLQYTISF